MITVYISQRCNNSMRIMSIVRRTPSLQGANIVDVERGVPPGIDHVPTIVDDRGMKHTGAKAFEFLKKFDGETEIEAMDIGSGGLAYGSIEAGGELEFSGFGARI